MVTYTHGHHESVLRSHTWRTAANSAGYLLGRLDPGMSLLDVGCGPGTITADLAGRVRHVTAIDTAADVLDQAARRAPGNVTFAVGDVHALAFADGTFDVVHAHQVLQHVADPVAALREMRRVCAPGGIVAARDADYSGFIWYPQPAALDLWRDLYQRVARANRGEPDAGRRLLSWAQQAGFGDLTPTGSLWCYATAATRDWWGGMWADRILHSTVAGDLVRLELATTEQLEEIAAAWREWAAAPDGWIAIPHGEIICRP
jgi:SAM-dependent methyltransferase